MGVVDFERSVFGRNFENDERRVLVCCGKKISSRWTFNIQVKTKD